ncbi:C19orf12-like protein [Cryptotermes secundus]|uniref:C19orf12-like protein n=2 Tax=Cryptotermes secundus TaxID=105785 RepID=A0A2J7R1S0_9NEOP|nr:protein C19orf12 homolog isoform X1 [Cryptotermes secundus]XP_023706550.1 protein C19orf12 homolog isoform X1 [Cryptotermes secundus]PNF34775.1 C19orf12-like protein [Cryptotermes secundus]
MPVNSREILNVVTELTEDRRVRVTMTESFKGGCIAATTTIIGGMVLGPAGLAIGGAVGGCAAAIMSKDKFKPIPQVIMNDMTDAQRERLVASVSAVIADLRVEDIALLLPLLLENRAAKEAILRSVFAFLQTEMQLQIMD